MILVVSALAIGIAVYVIKSMNELREALPADAMQQQQDVSEVLYTLAEVVRASETAKFAPTPEHVALTSSKLRAARARLGEVRKSYVFGQLTSAAAMHASVHPALEDIERWLSGGIPQFPADSPVVRDLVHLRAKTAYDRTQALFSESNRTATGLITSEARRLERFRNGVVATLAMFTLMTLGIIVLYIRERFAEERIIQQRNRLTDSIESLNEGFVLFDKSGRLVTCNQRYRDIYPMVADSVAPGAKFTDIAHLIHEHSEGDAASGKRLMAERMQRHRNPGEPFEIRLEDGRCIRVSEHFTREGGSVGIHADITDLRLAHEQLKHVAAHDTLTRLPNRAYFEDRLNHALAQSRRHQHQVAVMCVDLDRFKLINDSYGHEAGDKVLKQVAETLKECIRDEDTVARIGGDEFAVVLENVQSWEQIAISAERLVKALDRTIDVGVAEVSLSVSIGASISPQDGNDIATLMRNADAAGYHAKNEGRNCVQFFTEDINARATERARLAKLLRGAIENEELELEYQPIIDATSSTIFGMEALMRWESAELGVVPHERILVLTEDSGRLGLVSEWMMRQACSQNKRWREQGIGELRVFVRVSPSQFRLESLDGQVERILDETGLDPNGLALEVSEGAMMGDDSNGIAKLQALSEIGVKLFIDRFGLGFSTLAMLKKLTLTALKLDPSLVSDIADNADDAQIVNAIIATAHGLKAKIVADGVATEEQLGVLKAQGCDGFQGPLIGAALGAEAATQLLQFGGDGLAKPPVADDRRSALEA